MLPRVLGCPPTSKLQIPISKSEEGAGTRPCRESEGVPRSSCFLFPQEWGTKGVDEPHLER